MDTGLVKKLGFYLIVTDDRREFVSSDRFPEADELWYAPFEEMLREHPVFENDYLVIVTRGHQHDFTVLRQALQTAAGYVGMIGSRRKRELIYQELIKQGFSQVVLDAIHAPIGVDINAQTPEEIAFSIVAELIAERGAKIKRKKEWEV